MKRILLQLVIIVAVPSSVLALGGPISSPELGFSDDSSPETIEKVLDFLNNEVAFTEGFFVNWFTTQNFSGSTVKVEELIALLNVSGFNLTVAFGDLGNEQFTFRLFQNSGDKETNIKITINTASTNDAFDLSKFSILIPATKQ